VLEHFYGPNDDATKFVSWLLKELLFSDGDINLTKGLQKRDFIYISDVVSAFIFIIKNIHMICKDKNYVEIEVGSGQSLPLRHVVELCAGLCAANYDRLKFGALPYRENEMMNIDVNIEPLIDLGWASNVPLVEGLRKTINSTKWNG
jgi:nucleoside-diphosphate-sugar epimerase